jgi:hypothetical protein
MTGFRLEPDVGLEGSVRLTTWDLAMADFRSLIAAAANADNLPSPDTPMEDDPGLAAAPWRLDASSRLDTVSPALSDERSAFAVSDSAPVAFTVAGAPPVAIDWIDETFPSLCFALAELLENEGTDASLARLESLWRALDRSVGLGSPLLLGRPEFVDLSRLAKGVAFNSLRHVLITHRDAALPPFGSIRLFHASMRLRPDGLGPGFGNVVQLVCGIPEILMLIRCGWASAQCDQAETDVVERLVVVLSGAFGHSTMIDLVHELGDAGLVRAVRGILAQILRRPRQANDHALLGAVRDAALDARQDTLALSAQRRIAVWWPENVRELVRLGEMEGRFGEPDAAADIFEYLSTLVPHDGGVAELGQEAVAFCGPTSGGEIVADRILTRH